MKRIGIIALLHESNTFLNEPTTLEHFRCNLLATGNSVINALRGSLHETGGFIDVLDAAPDLEPVGVFAARAMPYGPIAADCWNFLKQQLQEQLSTALPLDGLLVAPHGATVAENAADADGDWLQLVRNITGPDMLICGTLDLHANVSPEMVHACDALFGYRTNPHLDQFQCGQRAAECLASALRNKTRPVTALVQIPLVVNIERQATSEPQGQQLFLAADAQEQHPDLIGVSCLYGFPYSDVAEMGASVVAVAKSSAAAAEQAARDIASLWWQMRDDFTGQLVSVEDAVARALQIRTQHPDLPVGLLDMGDNTGGGSPGDGTTLAHAWLQRGQGRCLAILADADAAALATAAGVDSTLQLSIGGKIDPLRHGPPIADHWTVRWLSDGRFRETQPRHGGYSDFDQGPTAVLEGSSGLTVVATTLRVAPLSLQQILSQNIQPTDFAAIILKGVHAPVAAYAPVCSELIRVNTDGATTADLSRLSWSGRRQPLYPLEPLHDWSPHEDCSST